MVEPVNEKSVKRETLVYAFRDTRLYKFERADKRTVSLGVVSS
jgi:hypothetical protein